MAAIVDHCQLFCTCAPGFTMKIQGIPSIATRPTMLDPIANDLWSATQQISVHGLPVRTRMTVVRLAGGALWLHSPIAPAAALRAALDTLGDVRWIVAPNRMHHLFAGDWQGHYPQAAQGWAPSALTCPSCTAWTRHCLRPGNPACRCSRLQVCRY